MDILRGFLSPQVLVSLSENIARGYKSAQDLQNPPLSVQLITENPLTGAMEPSGEPFQPIRIRFGLREVADYGDGTPIETARADADMKIWGVDPDTGLRTPESFMRIDDRIEWTVEGSEYVARVSAIYPIEHGAMSVEIELVQ